VAIGAISEDLPSLDNRVILDDSLTDSHGIPAPKIIYRRDANNIAMLDWHLARITEALEASGALIVYTHPIMADQPGHLLGTARMGTDRQRSVVDPFGRCHDVPNLIIADGSVFVTSGGVNPTNTICALALRSATELVRTRAEMETSA